VPDREPDFYELISQWLPIWDESHLPYIPLNEIGRAPAREWIDGVEGDWSPAVAAAMASAAETTDDAMVRWDHCSGDYLKHFMDRGRSIFGGREKVPTHLDDIRFFELTMDFADRHGPDRDLIMWRRPWVQAIQVDGYPLEFRAFVADGEIVGVSSYYPQRDLPEEMDIHAQRAWEMTELLVGLGPLDFTCDWLLKRDGSIVIVECGPPHLVDRPWADPCCFVSGQIHGIALRPMPGSDAERRNASRSRLDLDAPVPWIQTEPDED